MTAVDHHARYVDWDAAYVLGSLSSDERFTFEEHLEDCGLCRSAVAELAGLPGLLRSVPDRDALALLSADPDAAHRPPKTDRPAKTAPSATVDRNAASTGPAGTTPPGPAANGRTAPNQAAPTTTNPNTTSRTPDARNDAQVHARADAQADARTDTRAAAGRGVSEDAAADRVLDGTAPPAPPAGTTADRDASGASEDAASEVHTFGDAASGTPASDVSGPPHDLLARMRKREASRRRARGRTRAWVVAGIAAAVILVAAVVSPSVLSRVSGPSIVAVMEQVQQSPLSAHLQLSVEPWGTSIRTVCDYRAGGGWATPEPKDGRRYGLYVIDSDGAGTLVSSWKAAPGSSVTTIASTAIPLADITSVEIRSMATGATLLSALTHPPR